MSSKMWWVGKGLVNCVILRGEVSGDFEEKFKLCLNVFK